ncbi:hypothetical protein LEP1GSC016_4161 [Leptospira borgpetersenii serovar Hardjo-bovis str. Sponselee]|uniref:Uncharacterized protein n=1 Tax=Leptospira borgpetersenii serovar Hardjo-bovis str. Sponselee TaxID=1303729 RepID=M6BVK5_LEPBO|nr:hypothetical protein LEP1GSC016_4161 [Leptospira borgpetersenii serovar Hardjo-bovis str. Sponselee]
MLKENIEIFFFRNENHIEKEDIKFESTKIHGSNSILLRFVTDYSAA